MLNPIFGNNLSINNFTSAIEIKVPSFLSDQNKVIKVVAAVFVLLAATWVIVRYCLQGKLSKKESILNQTPALPSRSKSTTNAGKEDQQTVKKNSTESVKNEGPKKADDIAETQVKPNINTHSKPILSKTEELKVDAKTIPDKQPVEKAELGEDESALHPNDNVVTLDDTSIKVDDEAFEENPPAQDTQRDDTATVPDPQDGHQSTLVKEPTDTVDMVDDVIDPVPVTIDLTSTVIDEKAANLQAIRENPTAFLLSNRSRLTVDMYEIMAREGNVIHGDRTIKFKRKKVRHSQGPYLPQDIGKLFDALERGLKEEIKTMIAKIKNETGLEIGLNERNFLNATIGSIEDFNKMRDYLCALSDCVSGFTINLVPTFYTKFKDVDDIAFEHAAIIRTVDLRGLKDQMTDASLLKLIRNLGADGNTVYIDRLFVESNQITSSPLDGYSTFYSLHTLDLRGCSKLTELSNLNKLTQLNVLNLRGCSSLQGPLLIDQLVWLQYMDLEGCSSLKDINLTGHESLVHVFFGFGITLKLGGTNPLMNRYDKIS